MENNNDTHRIKRSSSAWLGEMREFLRGRFSLDEDKAQRDEVVASISKGVVFRGVNLWVLIFATMIASLGLNVNSAAVIIGAMLISPIMGPIMGIGLSLGINDFELLKKSLRNYALMFVVAIVTSTAYFLVSPLSSNSSELLARTVPTTYDVLIALFGGLAGIVAQTRQDRTSTVIPGVAIATALIPPLCTAGFGLATGQIRFFFGAFYLFFINSVFIALATYAMVRFLKYEKKAFIDKVRERNVKRLMMVITLVTFIPSVVIGFHMVRVSLFEAAADKYVSQVFNFPHTRVIECNKRYAHHGQDRRGVTATKLPRASGGEEQAHRRDGCAAETLPRHECRGGRHFARGGCHDHERQGHIAHEGHYVRRFGRTARYDARLCGHAESRI